MIAALHPPRRFAGRLHRWQQQRHQDADDGDNHQKFYESEGRVNLILHAISIHRLL